MKNSKVLCLVMVLVMLFTATGCQGKKIKLTLDNYLDYFIISEEFYPGGDMYEGAWHDLVFTGVAYTVNVKPISDNFHYNNVTFEVKMSGEYWGYTIEFEDYGICEWSEALFDYEHTFNLPCNIAGEGAVRDTLLLDKGATTDDFRPVSFEIVSVSGSVTPIS